MKAVPKNADSWLLEVDFNPGNAMLAYGIDSAMVSLVLTMSATLPKIRGLYSSPADFWPYGYYRKKASTLLLKAFIALQTFFTYILYIILSLVQQPQQRYW